MENSYKIFEQTLMVHKLSPLMILTSYGLGVSREIFRSLTCIRRVGRYLLVMSLGTNKQFCKDCVLTINAF